MSEHEELVKSLNLCAVSTDPIYECCLEDCVAHKGDFDPLCMGTLMLKAADAIEELSETVNMQKAQIIAMAGEDKPRWISVDEALPEKYGTALVTTERGSVMVCCYYPQAKNWNTRAKVKWWMLLPQPPQEAQNEL